MIQLRNMKQKCEVVELVTKDKLKLNGLWFGPEKPKQTLIFVHCLGGSAFGHHDWLVPLINKKTSILFFSNRGNSVVSRIKKLDERKKKGYTSVKTGQSFEVFTDCKYDLQTAVDLAKDRGTKDIYLVGHSTGCQKSIYYLSKRGKQKYIKGVILLCPISDYSGMLKEKSEEELNDIAKYARKMISLNKGNELLPEHKWGSLLSAKRFLSLYTPNSIEEIFSYLDPDKKPSILHKVKVPILAIFAEKDEYADRPAKEIADWFEDNSKSKNLTIKIIKDALHSFQGKDKEVSTSISTWIQKIHN